MEPDIPVSPINNKLFTIAERVWPELRTMQLERRIVGVGDVITTFYTFPLAILGLFWLVAETNLTLVRENLWFLFLHGVFIVVLNRLNFFLIVELRDNRYGSANGSLDSVVLWSALFLLGPAALWLSVIWSAVEFIIQLRATYSTATRWGRIRDFSLSLAGGTLTYMVALSVFQTLGGSFPIQGVRLETFLQAIAAILAAMLGKWLLWLGYIFYGIWTQRTLTASDQIQPVIRFFILALGLPVIAEPFSILAAGLYVNQGNFVYTLLFIGLFIVAVLTRQLSWMAESNRQQYRILNKLEEFGRAIITAPPEGSKLENILEAHLPNMFPSGRLAIWTFPDKVLFKNPPEWKPAINTINSTLLNHGKTVAFLANETLPWQDVFAPHFPAILTPIIDIDKAQPIGGIYIELRPLAQPWYRKTLSNLFPSLQSLAAQIASALHQESVYARNLDYQRLTQELELAGQIQSSLMPFKIPSIPGWELAVTLDPAGETSGDFFDIIPLSENRLGIVIADVADKGIGPALYMALSRTLLRTFAVEFDAQPEIVFFATNERILRDTEANLFVTVFFGILDLDSGQLTYSNAGHHPPYLISTTGENQVQALRRTGIPIGIEEGVTWSQEVTQLNPGDILLLYTDGIPDAQNNAGDFFGETSLVETVKNHPHLSAEEVQKRIIQEVYAFMDETQQFDDITLIVLIRNI